MSIRIIQHSTDGFGHQLHGLFTVLALHGIQDVLFDASAYINKPFTIAHNANADGWAQQYLCHVVERFSADHPLVLPGARHLRHISDFTHLATQSEEEVVYTVYTLDNAYHFVRLRLYARSAEQHQCNIKEFRRYFATDLPNPFNKDTRTVLIHVRMGDAMRTTRAASILRGLRQLPSLLRALRTRYPTYNLIIHTDNSERLPVTLTRNATVFGRDVPIKRVLCEMVHSDVLVCGNSSLSMVCCFLRDPMTQITLIPDDTRHSVPAHTIKIGDFVKRKDVKRKDVKRKDVKRKDVKRKDVKRKDVKRKETQCVSPDQASASTH